MIYVILSNDVFIMNIFCQDKKLFIIILDCQHLSQPGAHLFRSGPGVRVRPLLWLCVGSHIFWEESCSTDVWSKIPVFILIILIEMREYVDEYEMNISSSQHLT